MKDRLKIQEKVTSFTVSSETKRSNIWRVEVSKEKNSEQEKGANTERFNLKRLPCSEKH